MIYQSPYLLLCRISRNDDGMTDDLTSCVQPRNAVKYTYEDNLYYELCGINLSIWWQQHSKFIQPPCSPNFRFLLILPVHQVKSQQVCLLAHWGMSVYGYICDALIPMPSSKLREYVATRLLMCKIQGGPTVLVAWLGWLWFWLLHSLLASARTHGKLV